MNSIKFKAEIDYLPPIVRVAGDVIIESRKLNDDECLVELTSKKDDDEAIYLELMSAMAKIVGEIDSHNIQFVY